MGRVLKWVFLVVCCAFIGGWGLANYEVHLFDEYYLLCSPRQVDLVRRDPTASSDGVNRYGVLCAGVFSYGVQDRTVYGRTRNAGFFIMDAGGHVRRFLREDTWCEQLAAMGISEPRLIQPHPPRDDTGSIVSVGGETIVVGVIVLAIVALSVIVVAARRRGAKRSALPRSTEKRTRFDLGAVDGKLGWS